LLVETLMTVAIIGIAFVSVFGALFNVLRVSDFVSRATKADVVVRAYAEVMKHRDGDFTYIPCTVAGGVVTYAAWTPPAPYGQYRASIVQIRYLTGYSSGRPIWSTTCPAIDGGTQEIVLMATGPINDLEVRGAETVVITKRDARGES
jgi:type II secretory pathway pseudopilin PulG